MLLLLRGIVMLPCLFSELVFKAFSFPFPLEKIQDHSLAQAPVEGESRGLETPWVWWNRSCVAGGMVVGNGSSHSHLSSDKAH